MRTAGKAARLEAEVDRAQLAADGRDLAYVTVALVDKQGVVVPRAERPVSFSISGPGEIVATDNGDPTSHVVFSSRERPTFAGLVLAIVRTKAGAAGTITLKAESAGLRPAEVRLVSQ